MRSKRATRSYVLALRGRAEHRAEGNRSVSLTGNAQRPEYQHGPRCCMKSNTRSSCEEHAALVEGVRGLAADLRRVAGMYKDAPSMGYLQGKADAYGRAAERLDALLTNAPPSRYDALVERVRGLHAEGVDGVYGQTSLACNGCKEMWPCRTIRLLTDEMEARR